MRSSGWGSDKKPMTPDPLTNVLDIFRIDGRVAVITGGAGLLGRQHAEVIAAAGGIPVLVDLEAASPQEVGEEIGSRYGSPAFGYAAPITLPDFFPAPPRTVLHRSR